MPYRHVGHKPNARTPRDDACVILKKGVKHYAVTEF